jgi:hypothetical protein
MTTVSFLHHHHSTSLFVFFQDGNDRTTWEHPAESCLGHFSLDHFSLAGSMLANGAMETSVVLRTISLVDQRPALEKGITTLVCSPGYL